MGVSVRAGAAPWLVHPHSLSTCSGLVLMFYGLTAHRRPDPTPQRQHWLVRAMMGKPGGLVLGSPVVEGESKQLKRALEGALNGSSI